MFASDQHRADETAAWLPRRQRSSWHRLPAGAVDDDVEEVCGDDDDVEDDDTVAKDNVEDDGGDDDNDNCRQYHAFNGIVRVTALPSQYLLLY